MNIISKSNLLKIAIRIGYIAMFAKILSLVATFYLPKSGFDFNEKISFAPEYARYSVSNILTEKEVVKEVVEVAVVETVIETPLTNISDIILKGIYKTDSGGYIIVVLKSDTSSAILSVNDSFNSYKLLEIKTYSAIFERNGKKYVLYMANHTADEVEELPVKKKDLKKRSIQRRQKPTVSLKERVIKRRDIKQYTKNFNQIWNDIRIDDYVVNGKLAGFKVIKMKPMTIFTQLGLKKGDIIKKVNNQALKSYADAFNMYEKINKLDALKITVLRNGSETDLLYDIK
ncbi:MAG: hypothetical protein GQ570_10050 [Helicobacteraceae bacterium]|nr:hypothetical protein [Helicobacteraceae bacterium]